MCLYGKGDRPSPENRGDVGGKRHSFIPSPFVPVLIGASCIDLCVDCQFSGHLVSINSVLVEGLSCHGASLLLARHHPEMGENISEM